MKIDVYAHIFPKKFMDYCSKHIANWGKTEQTGWPALWDIDKRLEIMDRYEDYVQVGIHDNKDEYGARLQSNIPEVLWVWGARCDPEKDIGIIRGCGSDAADPILTPETSSTKTVLIYLKIPDLQKFRKMYD